MAEEIYVTHSVDLSSVRKKLEQLARSIGYSMRDIMYDQARLSAQDAIKSTPPMTAGGRISVNVGKRAIAKDVGNLVYYTDSQNIAAMWTRGQNAYVRLESGDVIKIDGARYDPSGTRLSTQHAAKRKKSTGRVSIQPPHERLFVRRAAMRAYLKDVYSRSGKLAAGWIRAAEYFSAKSPISAKVSIPDFVARHGARGGRYIDAITPSGGGYAELVNDSVRYGPTDKRMKTLLEKVARTRDNDMARHLARRLKRHAQEFGAA